MALKHFFAIALLAVGSEAATVRGKKAAVRAQQGAPLKEKMPWYHTTDEIHDQIAEISSSCQGADIQISTKTKINGAGMGEIAIDVLTVRSKTASPRTKAMFVFGEHARELVSPESGLDLLRSLCGQGSGGSRISKLLETVEFTVVVNANPLGRKKVEEGFYCKRTNEDNVDLNRNWGDAHRGDAMKFMGDEMDPGPNGFSEPETQILKEVADALHPDVYLSIHTGAYLLGAPWGYTADKTPSNQDSMVEILKPISDQYCGGSCPYGGLADLIGYNSLGCDVDYMAETVKTPYAYTWEIYVGPEIKKHYVAEARERRGGGGGEEEFLQKSHLRKRTGARLRALAKKRRVAELRSWYERPESEQDWDSCIEQFNPRTAEETRSVVENWTGAYLDLAESVDAKRHPKPGAAVAPPPTQKPAFFFDGKNDPFAA